MSEGAESDAEIARGCDPYVHLVEGKWWWNCLRQQEGGPFRRRMDAADDAYAHELLRCPVTPTEPTP